MYYFQLVACSSSSSSLCPTPCPHKPPDCHMMQVNLPGQFWSDHIMVGWPRFSFPFLTVAVCLCVPQEKVIPCLLRLKQANDPGLRAAVREALTLVGYHTPVKGRGIRILSIDGGGLRYQFGSFSFLYCKIWVTDVKSFQSGTNVLYCSQDHVLKFPICLCYSSWISISCYSL